MIANQELLRRARRMEEAALAEIYDQYSDALFRYCARLLGDAEAAEDCVAETFSRFLHALHRGGGPKEHIQAYLYRVAGNLMKDSWRRRAPSTVPLDEVEAVEGGASPSEIAGLRADRDRLRAALAHLTEEQRMVIVLKFLEGLENSEIAQVLGKSIGPVKALQHRGLRALERALSMERGA